MARKQHESYFGSEYLTPSQRFDEIYRLAPGGSADASIRLREDLATAAAANVAANPLLAGRNRELGELATGTVLAPAVSTEPNPLTRAPLIAPPVPLDLMGTEQRIAWENLEQQRREKQMAAEMNAFDLAVARSKREQEEEQISQGRALVSELPKLQEKIKPGASIEDYEIARAELASKFPAGITWDRAQAALKPFDDIYKKRLDVEAEINRAETTRRETAKMKRIEAGYKEAASYGAEVERKFGELIEKNPEEAYKYLAEAQRDNLVRQLRQIGKTEEQIAAQLQGPGGLTATEAELKRSMTPAQQATQLRNHLSDLTKLRADIVYYSSLSESEKAALDTDLKNAREEYNAIQNRGHDNRIGIGGMPSVGAMQVAQQQQAYYAGNQGVVPYQQPQAPAGPVRSEAPLAWTLPAIAALAQPALQSARIGLAAAERARALKAAETVQTPAQPPVLAAGTRRTMPNGRVAELLPNGRWREVK